MLHIFEITFPFFALVLCGYAAARCGLLPLDAIPGLNLFVLYFTLPCMLFRFGAATPIARMLDASIFGTYLLCALVMVGACVATTRRGPIGWNDASFGALVAAFPNSGFMGVPLLVGLLGERAAGPAIVALTVDMVITSSLCIALSRLGPSGAHGSEGVNESGVPERAARLRPIKAQSTAVARATASTCNAEWVRYGGTSGHGGFVHTLSGRAVLNALKGVATNPLPWAIALGCGVSASGITLPAMLLKPVAMLADAASPAALFTLGAVLARSRLQSPTKAAVPQRRSDVPLIVFYKLIVHPALVLGTGRLAIAAGLPLDAFAATVLVLLAALPSASSVPMLAERFGADAGRIARIVLVSTALAFLSFSAAVALLV